MPRLNQILESIEARLAELYQEMAALGAARAALDAEATSAAPKRAASTRRTAKPRRRQPGRAASTTPSVDRATASGNGSGTATGNTTPSAVAAPTSTAPEAGSPAAKPRRARRRPAKPDRRVEVLLAGKLEAMLLQTPDGLSAVTISKRANAGYNQVRDLLRELEASGQVRRTGTRRTSLWQLITEEEHIAERAAELARLSAGKSGDQSGS